MNTEEIIRIIDREIKQLWKTDIQRDYANYMLLKEDSLKNAFYHHLRTRLTDDFLIKNQIRIYTEFNSGELKGTGKRADIAIVRMKNDDEGYEKHLSEETDEILAIIELKHKYGYGKVIDDIYKDLNKVKEYIQKHKLECQFYLGIIHEEVWDKKNWLDERSIKHWPQGKLTELVASRNVESDMQFDVYAYNGINEVLNDYK